jgi:hypothetical protein
MRRRRLLLGLLVGAAFIAPLLVGAVVAATLVSGAKPACWVIDDFFWLGGGFAFLAAIFAAGQVLPDSWPMWLQEAVTLLAAIVWAFFSMILGQILCGVLLLWGR